MRGENWSTQRKTSWSRVGNQQTPQILECFWFSIKIFSFCVKLHLICNMFLKDVSCKRTHEPKIMIIINNMGGFVAYCCLQQCTYCHYEVAGSNHVEIQNFSSFLKKLHKLHSQLQQSFFTSFCFCSSHVVYLMYISLKGSLFTLTTTFLSPLPHIHNLFIFSKHHLFKPFYHLIIYLSIKH